MKNCGPVLRREEPYLKKAKSNRDRRIKLHRDGGSQFCAF